MHVHGGDGPVDVALALLAERGFDVVSMTQIADATGLSVDDFVHRYGTKEAIVLAVAKQMLVAVVDGLADIAPDVPIVEALKTVHTRVLADTAAGTGPVPLQRMRSMGKAITTSVALQKLVAQQRVQYLSPILAEHFGASPDDPRVRHALKVWSGVLAATYLDVLDKQGRFDPRVDDETPQDMHDRLDRAFLIITGRPKKDGSPPGR